jgi:hypothetical protein
MQKDHPPDGEVEGWLKTLGLGSLCQWDVLVFLYRHQTTLVGGDYLARLLGYATEPVVAALDALDSLGLVARSRVSQGARLYQFTTPPEPPRGGAFERLLALAGDRAGRLRLSKLFTPKGFDNPARGNAPGPSARAKKQPSRHRDKGRGTWRRAI